MSRPPNPRRLGLATAALASAASAMAGCRSAEPAVVEPGPPVVSVSTPMARPVVDYDVFTGRTQAVATVDVRARVQGYLQEIRFQDGDLVEAGQVLFVIDPREYRASLDLSQARVEEAEARARLAAVERDRYRFLAERDAGSRQDYDRAVAALAVSQAETRAAEAERERMALDLEFTEVVSPIDGQVGRHQIDVGNLITVAESPNNLLTTVTSIDPMYVYFVVDERSLLNYQKMAREQAGADEVQPIRAAKIPVQVGLADEPGYPHAGVLDFADTRIDPSTGTITVRAVLPNADRLLRPGLFARVRVAVSDPRAALLVPETALGSDQGIRFVYVVDEEGRVLRRVVSTGQVIAGLQVIDGGLEPDDRVIVNGLQRVREGITVSPTEVEPPMPPGAEEALASALSTPVDAEVDIDPAPRSAVMEAPDDEPAAPEPPADAERGRGPDTSPTPRPE